MNPSKTLTIQKASLTRELNKKQEPLFSFGAVYKEVFKTNKRYIDAWGGRGRGGSHFGTSYFLYLIMQPGYFRGYFLRNTFNDIRDSLFRDFLDRIEENPTIVQNDFHINENEMRITYIPTGNMIMSKGAKKDGTRSAKLKSLAGATHVLIEEADELGEEDFDQLDLSLRTTRSNKLQIIRIFNPPHKQHWIWNNYILTESNDAPGYFTATPTGNSNTLSIFSTYYDNSKNIEDGTKEKFETFKNKKPEYYWTIVRGLISEGAKGRIFSGWQPCTDAEFVAADARSIWGLDFGTSSPAGIVEAKIIKDKMIVREHNYVGMTAKEIAIKLIILGVREDTIIADSAEPLTIQKLRRGWDADELMPDELLKYPQLLNGFCIYAAFKGPGSIYAGISKLGDMDIYVTEDSKNLWNEYREYKWALDKNKNPTDDPIDDFNHLIDPMRYIILSRGRHF